MIDQPEWPGVRCEALGPGLPDNSKLANYWDSIALTAEEDLSLTALRLTHGDIERVAVIGEEGRGYRNIGRRVVVKLKGHPQPVPLKSLGDGITRLFAVALAIANSRDGFLLIDEAENGIHHSIQTDFWRMVLRAAVLQNVQVFSTTHSKDCINGFARASNEIRDAEGVFLRLERENDEMWAVEYRDEDLKTSDEENIEVR